MKIVEDVQRFGHHRNAFGFIRLLLASLVIVSHTPELADGDRHRELLSRIVGTTSFGDLAVDGFFLASGFLIAGSYLASRGVGQYLLKRVARIYPGFAASSLACVFVFGPLGGGRFMNGVLRSLGGIALRIAELSPPTLRGAFGTRPVPLLSGAAWTIQYEFACYLLVILLGMTGLLRRGAALAAMAAALLVLAPLLSRDPTSAAGVPGHLTFFQGGLRDFARLPGMFLAGAAFRALQHRITASARLGAVAGAGLVATLFAPALAQIGIALFGGYLLFAGARAGGASALSRINDANDVSYGVYLYAWPIEQLLLAGGLGGVSLWLTGGVTWLLALAAGWASWHLVEKPVMARVRVRRYAPAAAG